MMWAVSCYSERAGIYAVSLFLELDLQVAVRAAQAPPISRLKIRGQLCSVGLAFEFVFKKQRESHVGGIGSVRRSRLEAAEPVVIIVKGGQIEREALVGLDAVTQFVGQQHLRCKGG